MKIRLLWVSAARPLDDNICCITSSSHTFFNRLLLNQLCKKSSNKGISYKIKRKKYILLTATSLHQNLDEENWNFGCPLATTANNYK
jgi:hypothetical protein